VESEDYGVPRHLDCEPQFGFLVRTVAGYYGILLHQEEGGQWMTFFANGTQGLLARNEFWVLPLSYQSTSPASFHEILNTVSPTLGSVLRHEIGKSKLMFFRCGSCDKAWSQGEGSPHGPWHCPRCGKKQRFQLVSPK